MNRKAQATTELNPEGILKKVGAWQTGHFLFTSGLHGSEYMQCQKIMQYPRYGMQLARELARQLLEKGIVPTTVVGPALGAIHWEVFVATAFDELLCKGEPVRAIFAERVTDVSGDANAFAIRRGIDLSGADKVLVVEDVTTTGGSVRKVLTLVKEMGATPIAVAALVDRSGGTIKFDVPFHKLLSLNLESYEPEKCPLCAKAVPIDKPGSSKKA